MPSTDPVGDMLAMVKNASGRRHKKVSLPHSRMKEAVAKVLKSEGYLEDVRTEPGEPSKTLYLYLKYDAEGRSVFDQIRRVSTPGRRVYRGVDRLGRVQDGMGVSVLSTSKGLLSDREARRQRVGGEVICRIW